MHPIDPSEVHGGLPRVGMQVHFERSMLVWGMVRQRSQLLQRLIGASDEV